MVDEKFLKLIEENRERVLEFLNWNDKNACLNDFEWNYFYGYKIPILDIAQIFEMFVSEDITIDKDGNKSNCYMDVCTISDRAYKILDLVIKADGEEGFWKIIKEEF